MMKWLILAGIFVSGAMTSTLHTSLPGPCARMNYESCCPPGDDCLAVDDNGEECSCSADCYILEDCCDDVRCPENPKTCADIGLTTCCHDTSNDGRCEVHSDDYYCSCNVSCHLRNDCCPDAREIGCVPRTCSEAGLNPGCCQCTSDCSAASCMVKFDQGSCYCDWLCTIFNDCCDDVSSSAARSCPAQRSRDRTRAQARFKQASKATKTLTRQVFNEKGHGAHIHSITFKSQTPRHNFREAPASRIHRKGMPHKTARTRRPHVQATHRYRTRGCQ